MFSRANLAWLAVYFATMAALMVAMFSVRQHAVATFGSARALAQWQSDRDELEQRTKESPVRRRVTKSAEPPALVLMRDYFWRSLAVLLLLASALFFVFMIAVRGALRS